MTLDYHGFCVANPEAAPIDQALTELFCQVTVGTRVMDDDHLTVQANIICVLLFLVGLAAVTQHPAWFG